MRPRVAPAAAARCTLSSSTRCQASAPIGPSSGESVPSAMRCTVERSALVTPDRRQLRRLGDEAAPLLQRHHPVDGLREPAVHRHQIHTSLLHRHLACSSLDPCSTSDRLPDGRVRIAVREERPVSGAIEAPHPQALAILIILRDVRDVRAVGRHGGIAPRPPCPRRRASARCRRDARARGDCPACRSPSTRSRRRRA